MALPITVEYVVPASRAVAIVSLCPLLSDRLPTRKASRRDAEVGAKDVCVVISRLAECITGTQKG
jgi:hypothetical protein